ncbi:MAG: hypothetical protein JJU08_00880 [Rhodobacteraceae bacterium]|nr:hypothetical protein [Paracoccaceae bacterium]
MYHDTFDLTTCARCASRSGPCLAGLAFLQHLSMSLGAARKVTGTMPDMDGQVVFTECHACDRCVLNWRATAGELELAGADQVLLQGRVVAQTLQ